MGVSISIAMEPAHISKLKRDWRRAWLAEASRPCENGSTGRSGKLCADRTAALSSRGLGHRPLKAETRVRIPLALPTPACRDIPVTSANISHQPQMVRRVDLYSGAGVALVCCGEALLVVFPTLGQPETIATVTVNYRDKRV
jgi:hypothetical protein